MLLNLHLFVLLHGNSENQSILTTTTNNEEFKIDACSRPLLLTNFNPLYRLRKE